ncbi:MAG: hypothetical protein JWM64_2356, partial [Frankiales bacterium]|nr:hypothetical protein [Frankiales bacterium]
MTRGSSAVRISSTTGIRRAY